MRNILEENIANTSGIMLNDVHGEALVANKNHRSIAHMNT